MDITTANYNAFVTELTALTRKARRLPRRRLRRRYHQRGPLPPRPRNLIYLLHCGAALLGGFRAGAK
ncbi:hypothetical protein QN078_05305 [Ralstonia nicotianae]|uniref:hypothetical protein n=1 Tax=Ralstonia pseudosolanacearum TaxID=1310165 RepID=UPI000A46DE27|nr:hypothetical protein [Ralstonia pseudosolanacearum]MCK4131754.1 hypothetical protein [Ralstonia pseudosolanacearum]MCK4145503.1 hypothetical protein [Ralstonia pseudosolanacearum]MDK1379781.1 hypothetical protein [Ralstonia pseudosolanacearum]